MHYLYPDPPSIWSMVWPELLKGVPAAIVALVVAVIAGYIAWRQYQVARAKFDLDLFQQRYRVYEVLVARISPECELRKEHEHERFFVDEWRSLSDRALFLFGSSMKNFVDGVLITGQELDYLHAELMNQVSNADNATVASELIKKRVTMDFFRKRIHTEFSPFMDFSKWKR